MSEDRRMPAGRSQGGTTQLQLAVAPASCAGCGGVTTGLGGHVCGQVVAPELVRAVAFLLGERAGAGGAPEDQQALARARRRALIVDRVAALRARRSGGRP